MQRLNRTTLEPLGLQAHPSQERYGDRISSIGALPHYRTTAHLQPLQNQTGLRAAGAAECTLAAPVAASSRHTAHCTFYTLPVYLRTRQPTLPTFLTLYRDLKQTTSRLGSIHITPVAAADRQIDLRRQCPCAAAAARCDPCSPCSPRSPQPSLPRPQALFCQTQYIQACVRTCRHAPQRTACS